MSAKTNYLHLYIRGANTKIHTCAVDHIETEQSECRPRITPFYRDIVIMKIVNWISTEIIRLSMVLFDREKIPFFMLFDGVGTYLLFIFLIELPDCKCLT